MGLFLVRMRRCVFRRSINLEKHLFFFARRKDAISHSAIFVQMDILSGIKKCGRIKVSAADIVTKEHEVYSFFTECDETPAKLFSVES